MNTNTKINFEVRVGSTLMGPLFFNDVHKLNNNNKKWRTSSLGITHVENDQPLENNNKNANLSKPSPIYFFLHIILKLLSFDFLV